MADDTAVVNPLSVKVDGDSSPSARPASTILERFTAFFEARDSEKTQLYKRAVTLGWGAMAAGALTGVIGLAIWYTAAVGGVMYFVGAALAVLGTFVFTCGVCLISTVPTDEYCMDSLDKRPGLKRAFQLGFGFVCLVVGILFISFYPYFTGAPIALVGAWTLLHDTWLTRRVPVLDAPLSTKVTAFTTLLFIPVSNVYWCASLNPDLFTRNLAIPGLWADWAADLVAERDITRPMHASVAAIYLSAFLVCAVHWTRQAVWGARRAGWRTSVFYTSLHAWLIAVGLGCGVINITAVAVQSIVLPEAWGPNLAVVGVVLLPPLVTLLVGVRRCFTLFARRFELDLVRMMKDGALMAELVAACQVVDRETMSRWVYRRTRCEALARPEVEGRDDIARSMWARGHIEDVAHEEEGGAQLIRLRVRVPMAEDVDPTWAASYKGASLTFRRVWVGATGLAEGGPDVPAKGALPPGAGAASPARVFPPAAFDAWVAANFWPDAILAVDAASQAVVLQVTLANSRSTRDSLLAWARSNLRSFTWDPDTFEDHLLHKSPRELGSVEEKASIYALSKHVELRSSRDKIDFFVSHSWVDDPSAKIATMQRFARDHKRRAASPRVWLDKCCIDQRDPGNALAVLPINIGCCKRVLVLLSKSYLLRLWCLWELVATITFMHKELAIERIVILPITETGKSDVAKASAPGAAADGDATHRDGAAELAAELRSFDVDKAHAFDPNEEFKLRQIMADIGLERLRHSLAALANNLQVD